MFAFAAESLQSAWCSGARRINLKKQKERNFSSPYFLLCKVCLNTKYDFFIGTVAKQEDTVYNVYINQKGGNGYEKKQRNVY